MSTLLKEQELTAIDAMIAGQEKERQQVAADLHDNLGSKMSTLNLLFEAYKENPSTELATKIRTQLDDTYQTVRGMAHHRNSGVMANKGLVKAIKDMSETISSANKITIDIYDHGMDQRLENSLELTLFRVVQELITIITYEAMLKTLLRTSLYSKAGRKGPWGKTRHPRVHGHA